jgi:hypothetical protein
MFAEDSDALLHIEGPGRHHAAYRIKGLGHSLSSQSKGEAGFEEPDLKAQVRAVAFRSRDKQSTGLTSFELKFTAMRPNVVPVITSLRIRGDKTANGRALLQIGCRFPVPSSNVIGAGVFGIIASRSETLWGEVGYRVLTCKPAEQGRLRRSGDGFVVETPSCVVSIVDSKTDGFYELSARATGPQVVDHYAVVRGVTEALVCVSLDPTDERAIIAKKSVDLTALLGHQVSVELAPPAPDRTSTLQARVKSLEEDPPAAWHGREGSSIVYTPRW